MKSWPELHQRLLDLAAALREQGIVWRPFASREAEVQSRRSRVPDEVVASLKGLLREAFAIARERPTAADGEWFFRRFRELAAPLRGPGEIWAGIDPEAEHVLRGRSIPRGVMAEMKCLLDELRTAFRAKTTQPELASFARRCRELARSAFYRDKAADFEALAERSQRERTVYCEEYQMLVSGHPQRPARGHAAFVELGEGGVEVRTVLYDPGMAEVFHHRTEPTMDTYMSLWRLVAGCESGIGGLEPEPCGRVMKPNRPAADLGVELGKLRRPGG